MKDVDQTREQMSHEISSLRAQLAALEHCCVLLDIISDYAYVFLIEPDGTLVQEWIAEAVTHATGYSLEELNARGGWLTLVHPEDMDITQRHKQMFFNNQPDTSEFRIVTRSGEVRWVRNHCRPEWENEQGRVTRVYGIAQDITERKRAEQARRESEERHLPLFDNAGLGIGYFTPYGQVIAFNKMAAAYMGGEPENYAGKTLVELYGEEAGAWYLERIKIAAESEGSQDYEDFVPLPSGDKWFLSTYVRITDASGQAVGVQIISNDITKRKQAEEALRRANKAYRTLSNCNGVVVRAQSEPALLQDICRTIVEVGGYRLAWVGFAEQDEAKTVRPMAFAGYEAGYLDTVNITWDDSERGRGPTGTAIRTGKPVAVRYIATDPEYEPWREQAVERGYASSIALPLMIEDQIIGALNINAEEPDAFDQQELDLLAELAGDLAFGIQTLRTREKLVQERYLLRTLIDNLPDFIYVKDTEGRFIIANEADALNKGSKSADEVVGKTNFDYYPQEQAERFHADDQQVIQSGQPLINREEPNIDSEGNSHWFLTTKVPLRDTQEIVIGLVGIGRDITERKQVEEALRESEERYRTVADYTYDWEYWRAPDGRIRYMSPSCERISGYRADEFIENPDLLGTIVHPDDRHVFGLHKSLTVHQDNENGLHVADYRIVRRDGEIRWISHVCQIIRGADGVNLGRRASNRDITERKRAEEAEYEQRVLAEALSDSAAALINVLDIDTVVNTILEIIVSVVPNDAANIMLIENDEVRVVCWRGYRPERVPFLEDMRLPLSQATHLRHMLNNETPYLISHTDNNPGWSHLPHTEWVKSYVAAPIRSHENVIGFLNVDSGVPGFFTEDHAQRLQNFADQVSLAIEHAQLYEEIRRHASELEQRVAERTAELRGVKDRVEAILNSSPDAVLLLCDDGIIDTGNPAFHNLFGYQAADIFDQNVILLSEPGQTEMWNKMLLAALRQDAVQRFETVVRRKDGTAFAADVALAPIVPGEIATGIVCTIRDITEHKRAQESLHQALEKQHELLELKSRFISMVSHEFRNPLASIQLAASTLQSYFDRLDEQKRHKKLDGIVEQTRRMVELLEDVLTVGQLDESWKANFSPKGADLRQFCEDVFDEIRASLSQKHTLVFEHQQQEIYIAFDPKLMRQVVGNLLSNAIKYSPEGSTVRLVLAAHQEEITLSVADEGIGIPEADQKHLFETFHRAGNVGVIPGTGLGLAIVKRAVELHNGSITCESEIGKGTTFIISIPRMIQGER